MDAHDDEELQEQTDTAARHRKELKELRAHIQQLKKTISNSKQKKKEVAAEIAQLETEITERHKREILEESLQKKTDIVDLSSAEDKFEEAASEEITLDDKQPAAPKKPNRQQQRKLNKQAKFESMKKEAELEALNAPDLKKQESEAMQNILASLKLQLHEIPADGHCLYNAISHQLSLKGVQTSFKQLRKLAADFMRAHPDDFLPFLESSAESSFEDYCDTVERTAEWATQLEIRALSEALQKQINIIQAAAASTVVKTGEHFNIQNDNGDVLCVSYHLHAYGLGEHYNSLIPRQ